MAGAAPSSRSTGWPDTPLSIALLLRARQSVGGAESQSWGPIIGGSPELSSWLPANSGISAWHSLCPMRPAIRWVSPEATATEGGRDDAGEAADTEGSAAGGGPAGQGRAGVGGGEGPRRADPRRGPRGNPERHRGGGHHNGSEAQISVAQRHRGVRSGSHSSRARGWRCVRGPAYKGDGSAGRLRHQ